MIEIRSTSYVHRQEEILTDEALEFITNLHYNFSSRINSLLERRKDRQGLDFKEKTKAIRNSEWQVVAAPHDLQDRRVEITGPVDRKMIINALNSGANVFMADFEDSNSPTWENVLDGQINLRDAVNQTITFFNETKNKHYSLNESTATLMVRPRGLHLLEEHLFVNDDPVRGCLFDFGLYFFHNARQLLLNGSGPYFYLPKLESSAEAALWANIFNYSEAYMKIAPQSIRATVLIETLPAAFEMDEILWELRNYSAGLNCGRWDYIFSFIKQFKDDPVKTLPDRNDITMQHSFLKAYSDLLIKTCHKRQAHALGGMAAQIPIKNDPEANEAALNKVKEDKIREAKNGHDGTWVAHPALVIIAKEIFDELMPTKNQLHISRDDVTITKDDLVSIPAGTPTVNGVRNNISVGIRYIEAWLRGKGCVPINNLMEDAATAEISRTQLWQWLKHNTILASGEMVTEKLFTDILEEEIETLLPLYENKENKLSEATQLFKKMCLCDTLQEFLTLETYQLIK
jgi:malate synthase